jgi:hypothetical protein
MCNLNQVRHANYVTKTLPIVPVKSLGRCFVWLSLKASKKEAFVRASPLWCGTLPASVVPRFQGWLHNSRFTAYLRWSTALAYGMSAWEHAVLRLVAVGFGKEDKISTLHNWCWCCCYLVQFEMSDDLLERHFIWPFLNAVAKSSFWAIKLCFNETFYGRTPATERYNWGSWTLKFFRECSSRNRRCSSLRSWSAPVLAKSTRSISKPWRSIAYYASTLARTKAKAI